MRLRNLWCEAAKVLARTEKPLIIIIIMFMSMFAGYWIYSRHIYTDHMLLPRNLPPSSSGSKLVKIWTRVLETAGGDFEEGGGQRGGNTGRKSLKSYFPMKERRSEESPVKVVKKDEEWMEETSFGDKWKVGQGRRRLPCRHDNSQSQNAPVAKRSKLLQACVHSVGHCSLLQLFPG
jgi:hypothetical protein